MNSGSTLSEFLIVLGVAILSMALRSCGHVLLQKLGIFCVLLTSFLIGKLLLGSVAIGIALSASWLLLPWLDLIGRVRHLNLPVDRMLRRKAPPNDEVFPALEELTEEIEAEGYVYMEDLGLEWGDSQQFCRIFSKKEDRSLVGLYLIEQQEMSYYFVRIFSRTLDGEVWCTWNYPFSHNFKAAPTLNLNHVRGEQSFIEMLIAHEAYLKDHLVETAQLQEIDPERVQDDLQEDFRREIEHNLKVGILHRSDAGEIRYSWRGLFFIWLQFLKDFVRLS